LATPAPTPGFIETMQVLVVNSGLRTVGAIVILCIGWTLATYVKRWMSAALSHLPLDATLKPLLASLMRYAILIITLVLVLEQFGVQTTSLIAVLGAAGLAIGLAMQGTLSNVAAGVMLLILRPFRVGQFIEVTNQSGTVREIGLFTTILETRDSVYVSIPNSAIFGATIINDTRERLRRVNFPVTVDIVNDLGKVEEAIVAALIANSAALKEPKPTAGVQSLQEYSVVMFARAYIRSPDYWTALPALQRSVKDALDKAGILWAVTRQANANRSEPQSPLNAAPRDEAAQAPPQPAEHR
jgi:small conductance mechanosensitive channel